MQVVRNQMKDELKVVSENADVKSARISELEQTVSDLQQEKKELQDAVDGYTGVNGESHKVESLLQTATDYLSDPQDYEAIADTLYNVDTDYVQNSATDAYKQLYNKLMELVGSQVAEQMYRDGSAAINQSDYTTAISTLQKAWYFTRIWKRRIRKCYMSWRRHIRWRARLIRRRKHTTRSCRNMPSPRQREKRQSD